MKKIGIFILITTLMATALVTQGNQKKVALVKMKRGKAFVVTPDGSNKALKRGDWIVEGSLVKTEPKSFVKLSFIDKSSMNIGPSSEMKIEKFSKEEAGVINVLSGKIRSQVTKNYLNMDKDKSKLFVKSKSAVMGIRGTDFSYAVSRKTQATTAVLFEGSVVFNKVKPGERVRDLERVVNRGFRIKPGQFSVASVNRPKPTVPAKMNSGQFRKLMQNETFAEKSNNGNQKKRNSVVPPGLNADMVKGGGEGLQVIAGGVEVDKKDINLDMAKGYVKGDEVKPADGSLVHIESGTVIPIPQDATFDEASGEFVSTTVGAADSSGDYTPPEGFKITDEGNLLKEVNGQVVEVDLNIRPVDETPVFDSKEAIKQEEVNRLPAEDNSTGTTGDVPQENTAVEEFENRNCTGCNPTDNFGDGAADGSLLSPDQSKTNIQNNLQNNRTKVIINIQSNP
jgi:hypothetical protein